MTAAERIELDPARDIEPLPRVDPVVRGVRVVVSAITRTGVWRWAAPRVLPRIEQALGAVTGRSVQVSSLVVPSLILTTRGARSGLLRDTVLMYTPDGHGRAIVAGTNWASPHHPAWTYNLLAHPEAEITVRGRRYAVRASLIEGQARDRVWRHLESQWPEYRSYERDSGRTVRLFRLHLTAALGVEVDRRS